MARRESVPRYNYVPAVFDEPEESHLAKRIKKMSTVARRIERHMADLEDLAQIIYDTTCASDRIGIADHAIDKQLGAVDLLGRAHRYLRDALPEAEWEAEKDE